MPTSQKPAPRRIDSDTTHVSDSEPEREAHRQDCTSSDSSESGTPNTLPPHRTPLSEISNTVLGTESSARRTLESRLSAIERELAEIKEELRHRKRHRISSFDDSSPSNPPPKRARFMRNQRVGDDSAIREEPLIYRSSLMVSTPEREELGRCVHEGVQHALKEHIRRDLRRVHDSIAPALSARNNLV
ncbi:hypothetical protein C8J57DRAFT_1735057 [Mycena rebaudengoi]|nr:hypothetical protein C8J57DRAFT_1735057 [Mycena rebaudengoi]